MKTFLKGRKTKKKPEGRKIFKDRKAEARNYFLRAIGAKSKIFLEGRKVAEALLRAIGGLKLRLGITLRREFPKSLVT